MAIRKPKHRINQDIRYPKVRVVGDGLQGQILNIQEAIELASSMDKDVILISENANPPVVKIEDYNKFLYHQEKVENNEGGHDDAEGEKAKKGVGMRVHA